MQTLALQTPNGYSIAVRHFAAVGDSIVVIAPATGVPQKFYSNFATWLSQNGVSVVTFDYCGIAESKPDKLTDADCDAVDWGANDLETAIHFAVDGFSEKKVVLIGHSIGGQLIGLAESSVNASKIILVAAQSGYWKFWNGLSRLKMWANWHLAFPMLSRVFGYMPTSKVSGMSDLPKRMALQWSGWCRKPNYLFDDVKPELFFGKISCDVTSFSVGDDKFAPKAAVDWLAQRFTNAKMKRVHLTSDDINKHIGHFSFFQKKYSDSLWPMLLNEFKTTT